MFDSVTGVDLTCDLSYQTVKFKTKTGQTGNKSQNVDQLFINDAVNTF